MYYVALVARHRPTGGIPRSEITNRLSRPRSLRVLPRGTENNLDSWQSNPQMRRKEQELWTTEMTNAAG